MAFGVDCAERGVRRSSIVIAALDAAIHAGRGADDVLQY